MQRARSQEQEHQHHDVTTEASSLPPAPAALRVVACLLTAGARCSCAAWCVVVLLVAARSGCCALCALPVVGCWRAVCCWSVVVDGRRGLLS